MQRTLPNERASSPVSRHLALLSTAAGLALAGTLVLGGKMLRARRASDDSERDRQTTLAVLASPVRVTRVSAASEPSTQLVGRYLRSPIRPRSTCMAR